MNKILTLCLLLVFAAACEQRDDELDIQAAEVAIQQQIGKYKAALDAASVELASQVWDTSPDVSFIYPGGHQHGWEEIKGVYTFFGSTFTDRRLTTRDVSVHVLGDAAWAEFYWHFTAKVSSSGTPMESDGRETQVYRKNGDRWMLMHVHYSGPAMTFAQVQ